MNARYLITVVLLCHTLNINSVSSLENGTLAEIGQFPYTVLILYWNFDTRCTGALLSSRHILTAAHCPYIPLGPKINFAMAGDIRKPNPDKPVAISQQIRHFRKYVLHPKYSFAVGWRKIEYDIGIIILDMPFIFTDTLQPIALAKTGPAIGTKCIFPGWGFKTYEFDASKQNYELYYRYDTIYEKKTCGIKDFQIICGGRNHGCPGDCGGSIICNDKVSGIYTYALQIGLELRAVYTETSPHYKWIQSIVKEKPKRYVIRGVKYSNARRLNTFSHYLPFFYVVLFKILT